MENVVSKAIHDEEKHEHELVVAQGVELLRENVFHFARALLVHKVYITRLILVPVVEVSPSFQKIFPSKCIVLRHLRGKGR